MSEGWYEVAGGQASRIEGKLFFILDYPKPLADYNGDKTDDDSEMFFIDEARIPDWEADFSDNPYGLSWEGAQSLRHFGMANVLFLDGHVETLPLDPQSGEDLATHKYLRPDSRLWRYKWDGM
ncbi:MAG: H-X9-DG-CTERM domain-containing protein [Phycisphaerae bacterium]